MKKAIVAILILAIGAVAALPFVSGLIMERTLRKAVRDANALYASTGAGYSLEIIDYERGYRSSDIRWKIDLGALKAVYPIEAITFRDHAEHGFSDVVSTTRLDENPWYADFIADKLQGRDPIHITTRYGLSGSIESTLAVDAFSILLDGQKIDIQEGRIVTTTDRRLKTFVSTGNWQGLSAGEQMAIGRVSLASNLTRFTPFIWDGDFSFTLQDVNVREKKEQFVIKGMKGGYLLRVTDDRSKVSGQAQFSIDGMRTKNMTVDSASVRMATNGLDIDGYEALMQTYTRNMTQMLANLKDLDKNSKDAQEAKKQQMAAVGFQMIAAYERLLKEGLEFSIQDLHVKLDNGEIKGGVTLRLLKDMTFMQFATVIGQPQRLLDIFFLKSDFSLPAQLVGENLKLLTPLYPGMQTGLFVKKGDILVHQAETINGRLMVNNQEVILDPQVLLQPSSTPAAKGTDSFPVNRRPHPENPGNTQL